MSIHNTFKMPKISLRKINCRDNIFLCIRQAGLTQRIKINFGENRIQKSMHVSLSMVVCGEKKKKKGEPLELNNPYNRKN